ncbi:MAG: archease [Candidatus Aenigmarchaeota archaeon]|nr:archease [Candidatus Aenigmarchaeota archaeon]
MSFRFLDITTSDSAFEATGKDLNELFASSALAMFEVMINTKQIKPEVKRKVEAQADDLKGLLFEWLNELLVFYGAENLAFSKFEVVIDEKNFKLDATCWGEQINPDKHETRAEVKAATYHKMEIEKNDTWKARVIVDI